MAQTAYPKVGGATTDAQFRELFAAILETGAVTFASYAASADSTGMNVKVAPGFAVVDGIAARSTAIETLTIAAAAGGTLHRIDTVVLQLDYTADPVVKLKVLSGTPAASGAQAAPSLAPSGSVAYNWPIADVAVAPTAVTITSANLTDRRSYVGTNVGVWTTGLRPAGRAGQFGFNVSTGKWEAHNGTAWTDMTTTWAALTGKPATFPATAHQHVYTDVMTNVNENIVQYGDKAWSAKQHTHLSYDITVAGTGGQYLTDWTMNLFNNRAALAHRHSYADIYVNSTSQTITAWTLEVLNNYLAAYQPALGFTPVRQIGATNQIGWRWGGSRPVLWVDGSEFELPLLADVLGKRDYNDGNFGGNHIYTPAGRNTPVSSGYVSAYLNGDGRLGASASARRYKQNITKTKYSLEAARAIEVVNYRLKAAVKENKEAPFHVGVIAEQLIDAGLSEFVIFNDDGTTASVAYEHLALVALGAIDDVATRLEAAEKRLDELSAAVAALTPNN